MQKDLDLRKPGTSRHTTQRREPDEVRILSGVFEGKTTGTPIGLIIENTDQRSKDYSKISEQFRPAHADYTYTHKYGVRDYVAAAVPGPGNCHAGAAGAVARKFLEQRLGIRIRLRSQLGPIKIEKLDWDQVHQNPFFCPDADKVPEMEAYMDALRKEGDSIGARINVVADGVRPGWASRFLTGWMPTWPMLDEH